MAETKQNHICHNLETGSKRGQLVTDLVSNGLVCDAWWTSPPATGLSVERREDKEKQREECESLKEQTQDGSTVCRKPAGRSRSVLVLSSVPGHVWLWGASYGWAKRLCIFVCVHFLQGAYMHTCVHSVWTRKSVFLFFWSESSASKYSKKKRKEKKETELVQFGSLYGVHASGFICSNEGWLSRCVNQSVQGWRSSPARKCGWMWPDCSSYVGVNCIKMCGVCVQVCVRVSERGAESLTSFLHADISVLSALDASQSVELCHAGRKYL